MKIFKKIIIGIALTTLFFGLVGTNQCHDRCAAVVEQAILNCMSLMTINPPLAVGCQLTAITYFGICMAFC